MGTWNVKSMNQGKLEVVKQMARVNIDNLGISELKWTGVLASAAHILKLERYRED